MAFNLGKTQVSSDGKTVIKTGLIFRADNYEDKNFSVTPEELIRAAGSFAPVPLDVEHVDNLGILNGKLGTLEAVHVSDDGYELFGSARIPAWLNEVNGDEPFKVSCTWDRESKTLKKLALVQHPRVSDAALMAAFAKDSIQNNPDSMGDVVIGFFEAMANSKGASFEKTWDGRWTVQSIHDTCAKSGAICSKAKKSSAKLSEKPSAEFVTKEEQALFQKIHDLSTEYGAKCSFYDDVEYKEDADVSTDGENKMSTWENVTNFFSKFGDAKTAEEAKAMADAEDAKTALATELEAVKAEFAAFKAEQTKKVEEVVVEDKTPAVDPEVESLKAELATTKQAMLSAKADSFVEGLIKDNKVKPAQKDVLVALFTQAAKDDSETAATSVTFNDKKVENRLELLEALFSGLEPHKLNTEVLKGAIVVTDDVSNKDEKATRVSQAKEQAAKFAEESNKLKREARERNKDARKLIV